MEKTVFEMKLHETLVLNEDVSAMRVPGGWIYTIFAGQGGTTTFVPLSNEFRWREA